MTTPLIIAPGEHARELAEWLARDLPAEALVNPDDPARAMREAFQGGRALIGLCAAGILIRALAPLLADKRGEPPVIAVSADGAFIAPLLGGHNGANELARRIGWITGGCAAVTTASDTRFAVALDDPPRGWRLANPEDVKPFAAALLRGETARLEGHAPWLENSRIPFADDGASSITVTPEKARGGPDHLVYHPATVCIGAGLSRGAAPEELAALVKEALEEAGLAAQSIAAIGTIAMKADEPALEALCAEYDAPLRLFSAKELADVDAPNPSSIVRAETGSPSVAEAAALLLAGKDGELIVEKRKSANATCAIAIAPRPLTNPPGRARGRLFVVGLGPGDTDMRTPLASRALSRASDWVGYGLYLDLAADMAQGKRLHPFPLGGEEERVRHALALAAKGRDVALLCSGDAAIYAMAALVFEVLERGGVSDDEARVRVEVIPGVSAFQAASARAGALIGHDFCAISLSDLLTPWEVIERRLKAAARGDFVTALYNPRSRKRTRQLARALAILRGERPPQTPAIIASNLGRPGEQVRVLPLAEIDPEQVDMLSIVLIGARESRAFTRGDGRAYAYTPRGYAGKARNS